MTSKTDLCILLFGDRKPKHVDRGEDARVYVEAIAEIKRLRAENEALRTLANEAYIEWDHGRDVRVGKLLLAILDKDFRGIYRPDLRREGEK